MSKKRKRGKQSDAPARAVGSFVSPRTGQRVFVIPRKGESATEAMSRVQKNHSK